MRALAADAAPALARYARFSDVVELIRANRDMQLLVEVEAAVRLVRYQPGRIEFEPAPGAAPDLAQRLGQRLQLWTGNRWGVSVVAGGGAPAIAEARAAAEDSLKSRAEDHPLVQAVLARFPGPRVTAVRSRADAAAAPETPEEATVPDDWDPFEED